MADGSRLEDLRRRVQEDPASIAFAQLAEECRRTGRHQEAVEIATAGLAVHPTYLSARVTLGRALTVLKRHDEARAAFAAVLEAAPDNLAALRGLSDLPPSGPSPAEPEDDAQTRATVADRTVARLEHLLTALHGPRALRRA